MDSTEKESGKHPCFSWRNFGRGVVIFAIDAGLFMGVCWVAYLYVRFLVLGGRIDIDKFTGDDWTKIVGHAAWPVATAMVVFLFRNPILLLLYEAQGLIFRSYYRHGGDDEDYKDPAPGAASIGDVESSDGQRKFRVASEITVVQTILPRIEEQTGVRILRERSVRDSMYYFDGVAKINDNLHCFEFKTSDDTATWKRVFDRVQDIFTEFDRKLKERFVFVACVVGPDLARAKRDLPEIAEKRDFKAQFRFFEVDGDSVKEIL